MDTRPSTKEEAMKRIKELCRVKHMMSDWESHPKGKGGPNDRGGFIEEMELAAQKGWNLSEKQISIIDKMYNQHILGLGKPQFKKGSPENRKMVDDKSFKIGGIEGVRGPEGWRLKIHNTIIGMPAIREHAYAIAKWLDASWPSVEAFILKQGGDDSALLDAGSASDEFDVLPAQKPDDDPF